MSLSSIYEGSCTGEREKKRVFIALLSWCAKVTVLLVVKACREWENPWQYFAIPLTLISVPWDCSIAVDILYWHSDMCYGVDRKCHLLPSILSGGPGISSMPLWATEGTLQGPKYVEDICFLYIFGLFFLPQHEGFNMINVFSEEHRSSVCVVVFK